MKREFKQVALLTSTLVAGQISQLHAEDGIDPSLQLQMGLATSAQTSLYHDVGEQYSVFPLVVAEFGRYYLDMTNIGYRIHQGQNNQQLSMEIGRTFDGYESGDARFLSGMAERKAAWEAGLVYELVIGGGQLKGTVKRDISDTHNGLASSLEYEHSIWTDKTHAFSWFAGSEYWDSAKTDYYFGVEPTEARSGRSEYSAAESFNLFVGGNAFKHLNADLILFVSAEYRSISDAIAESPLVNQDEQWSTYGGIFYQFQ